MKRIYLLFIFFSAFFLNVNAQKGISETVLSPKIKVGPGMEAVNCATGLTFMSLMMIWVALVWCRAMV